MENGQLVSLQQTNHTIQNRLPAVNKIVVGHLNKKIHRENGTCRFEDYINHVNVNHNTEDRP